MTARPSGGDLVGTGPSPWWASLIIRLGPINAIALGLVAFLVWYVVTEQKARAVEHQAILHQLDQQHDEWIMASNAMHAFVEKQQRFDEERLRYNASSLILERQICAATSALAESLAADKKRIFNWPVTCAQ
jgi:protease II